MTQPIASSPTVAELRPAISLSDARNELVRETFNRAAEHFDDPALFFWSHCGSRTVHLSGLARGDEVVDVCCGTGAASLPAAEQVGDSGRVVGIDLAENPLGLARAKAARRGLTNLEFRCGDMTALDLTDESFDAVLCILGLYFAVDLPAAIAELWRLVRPGGSLNVTTWGQRALEPVNTMYLDAVGAQRPDLRPAIPSWERINTPDLLRSVFHEAGTAPAHLITETVVHRATPNECWNIVIGSGYRLLIDMMGDQAAAQVRKTLQRRMNDADVHELTADVIYARAVKPLR